MNRGRAKTGFGDVIARLLHALLVDRIEDAKYLLSTRPDGDVAVMVEIFANGVERVTRPGVRLVAGESQAAYAQLQSLAKRELSYRERLCI